MTARRALITGVLGQDGSYLAERLLHDGYEIFGVDRPHLAPLTKYQAHLQELLPKINFVPSQTTSDFIQNIVKYSHPQECYLLAAAHQSSQKGASDQAGLSSDDEEALYYKTNTHEPTEIMNVLAEFVPSCRIFVAGSCHMFGETANCPQSEKHPFHPCNLYSRTKVALWENCQALRSRLCIAFGVLYNHESPRRPFHFLSTRIARAAALAKLGETEKLTVGSLSARVDWSYAPDLVSAMVSLVHHGCNEDYILASGELHSVKDMVRAAFEYVGLSWKNFVQEDPGCYQPVASTIFQGNISKILTQKIWKPQQPFNDIVGEMVDYHLKKEQESVT